MALPAASSAEGIPGTVCCDTLSSIANRIRTVAWTGVESCIDDSCADREFRSFVSIGPTIQDPLGDSLVVHMTEFGPSAGSTNDFDNIFRVAVFRGIFEVRLLENGWPQVQTDDTTAAIIAPDADYIHKTAMHSMAHGEKMYRALTDSVQRHEMFVGTDNKHIGEIHVSTLTPIQPSAFMVGWKCSLVVETTL